ncbi:MAG TPA: caspase family protein [Candidatus Methanofastidiosa archaeon]|nr:caspase family protein [Candidatus Methanofastidiosa archaeon]
MKTGRIHLVSIGIDEYQIENLECACNDAKLIFEGYSKYNLEVRKLLLNSDAKRIDILKSLTEISKKSRPEDYLIFFFAGHGFSAADEKSTGNSESCFIVPYDYDSDSIEDSSISFKDIKDKLSNINADYKLLIFDSCYSGGALRRELKKGKRRDIKVEEYNELLNRENHEAIISACDNDESSYEDHINKHGFFTYYFYHNLEKSNSKLIPYKTIFEEIKEAVKTKVHEVYNKEQNPQCKVTNEDFKFIVFPKDIPIEKTELSLTLDRIPSNSERIEISITDFERGILDDIENNRDVTLEINLKNLISNSYKSVKNEMDIFDGNLNSIIPCYEKCRQQFLPIIKFYEYLLLYDKHKIALKNVRWMMQFFDLHKNRSGYTAYTEIPSTLLSEFYMKYIFFLGSNSQEKMYIPLFDSIHNRYSNYSEPLINSSLIWHPEVFHRKTPDYFEYIFPKEYIINNPIKKHQFEEFGEIIFLFYSFFNVESTIYPIFTHYIDDLSYISYKLGIGQYDNFIKNVLKTDKTTLLDNAIKKIELHLDSSFRWDFDVRENFRYLYNHLKKLER